MTDYFSEKGRLNRWPYFLRMCVFYGFFFLIWISMVVADYGGIIGSIGFIIFILLILIALPVLFIGSVFALAQSIQRLHDLDKSDRYILIIFADIIPLIGRIIVLGFVLYLFLAKGTTGPNRFGPDPLGGEAGDSNYPAQPSNSEVIDAEHEDSYENDEDQ